MAISFDIPFADYLRMPGEHFSTLKAMGTSPLHYRRACDHERADTPSLRKGRLTHALILTPDIPSDVVIWDGKARRGKAWDDFEAEALQSGKLVVKADELAAAHRMRDAVHANATARSLLRDGRGEVTVTWDDEVLVGDARSSIGCRARLDFFGATGLVELKTTRHPNPRSWAREVASRAYHVQLAHYSAGVESHRTLVSPYAPIWWIVVENVEPHDVAVYSVSREQIDAGERMRLKWLQSVAECEASGRWPGVGGDAPIDFVLPDYAAAEGLEDVDMSSMGEADTDHG